MPADAPPPVSSPAPAGGSPDASPEAGPAVKRERKPWGRPVVWARLTLTLAVLAIAVALYASGAHERLDVAAIREGVRATGLWAPLLYVLGFALIQPFLVPSYFFTIAATLVWSLPEAFVLSWLGAIGSAHVSFGFARFVARDWVQDRLPKRLERLDQRLEESGFRTLLGLRLVFFLTAPVQWAIGVSRVRFGPFVLATVLGLAPFTLIVVLASDTVLRWLDIQV